MHLELVFPLTGARAVPVDHGHGLYGALKRVIPALEDLPGLGIHSLRGQPLPGGMLLLDAKQGGLRLRLNAEHLPMVMPLAGRSISVLGAPLCLGSPNLHMLTPSRNLWARSVTLHFATIAWEEARTQLDHHLKQGYPAVTWQIRKPRTIRIHGKQILGFEVMATGVSEEDSLRLQENGFGGRRAFGCGIFVRVGGKSNA
ncbi:type I-MYXAN CRISPR-associated protein Cas6/Cmx6 [Geothrix sp. 21YS21S-4]|uniref:type I-MYXAN CRISPR-associated protein Cas6/Cmx6 n=1 Tax=Geothrix sp. 21YS21S-4 TaxID=3068889 RepID=UPI0027B8BAD5|nr:type I-MYXAN CRISPR-associated protein Cas6/Cmx6 [Geothrix sp. 21YS21S-4]